MNKPNINTKSYLEYLRDRRAKIDALIKAIEDFDDDGSAQDTRNGENVPTASSVNDGIYADMTIAAAAIHFIKTAGKPQPTLNIINGLKKGNLRSSSKSLYRTVYNTLTSRLDKELVRRGGKWGLKEWAEEVKQ